jgi:nicotinate-nucleotide adenylyltransferase
MKKIALFGTSADPPTAGHQTILKWLSQHFDLVAVWASDNPFKSHQASLKYRSKMLGLTIQELGSQYSNIGLYESLSYSRTIKTLEKAQEIWGKEVKFSLVIGSDLVPQIHKWYSIKELLNQVQLLIIPRPGYPINQTDLERLQNLDGHYFVADFNPPGVSSTGYRQKGDENVIPSLVAGYIQEKQLYDQHSRKSS